MKSYAVGLGVITAILASALTIYVLGNSVEKACQVTDGIMSAGSHDCVYTLGTGHSFVLNMSVRDADHYGWPQISDSSLLEETDVTFGSLGPDGPMTGIKYLGLKPGSVRIDPYGIRVRITN